MALVCYNNAEAVMFMDDKEVYAINKEIIKIEKDITKTNLKHAAMERERSQIDEDIALVENHRKVKFELINEHKSIMESIVDNGSVQVGKAFTKLDVANTPIKDLDIVIVARSIAHSESGNGKYAKHHNLCNTMTWKSGKRELKQFGSYQQGLNNCIHTLKHSPTWADKKYLEMTIPEMADLYTGSDNPDSWASNAVYWYKKYSGIDQ